MNEQLKNAIRDLLDCYGRKGYGMQAEIAALQDAFDPDDDSPDTFEGIKARLLRQYPNGELTEDEDGQLVFYLGLEEMPNGFVKEFGA